jgi:16S rRNA (guanine527-N7)-methyltransferase
MNSLVQLHPRWPSQLAAGLQALGLEIGQAQSEALLGYLGLLWRWNRVYNLTAVRDPELVVGRHLLDSLAILPWLGDGPVLDVGTGAGLPGIPLAIARPACRFTLLDSNGKKTRFVQQAVGELGLANVEVVRGRVEQLARAGHYEVIVSRAFAELADIIRLTGPLLAGGGRWLAMKGAVARTELDQLPPGVGFEVIPLTVPGEPGERNLVILSRATPEAVTAA